MFEKLVFCENCRVKVDDVTQLQFIEEDSDRGFCSEECILEFYRPFLQEFEIDEKNIRAELKIADESLYSSVMGDKDIIDGVLDRPDEVWLGTNSLQKEYFTHIKQVSIQDKKLYFIAVCSHIESGPSFIFYRTITANEDLVSHYRRDMLFNEAQDPNDSSDTLQGGFERHEVPVEIMESLDLKKSHFLAELMSLRSNGDIEFDQFHLYDKYLTQTLDTPDEIYEFEDEEGDLLKTYIKSFEENKIGFYYVVICYPIELEKENKKALLPVLTFPSVDTELYPHYARGSQLKKQIKN